MFDDSSLIMNSLPLCIVYGSAKPFYVNYFTCFQNINTTPEVMKIHFFIAPDNDIIDEILEEATLLQTNKQSTEDELPIFIFRDRHPNFGALVITENKGLHKLWNTL